MVIHGLLDTCSFFKLLVRAYFEKVLLRDDSRISSQECDEVCFEKCLCKKFCLTKYLGTNLPTRKRSVHFPLDSVILLLRNR